METVNHPCHYKGDTQFECIKVLENWFTTDEYIGFCKGNAIKYLCRAGHKNDEVEDLKKAIFYINKIIEKKIS